MMLTKTYENKLKKYQADASMKARTICPYCKEAVRPDQAYTDAEYIKHKSGTERFFHTSCFQRFQKGEIKYV